MQDENIPPKSNARSPGIPNSGGGKAAHRVGLQQDSYASSNQAMKTPATAASSPLTSASPHDSEPASPMPQVSIAEHLRAFAVTSPSQNLPFLKYRQWYLENIPSARHYSPAYVHDMAWSIWENISDRDAKPHRDAAKKEIHSGEKPASWWEQAYEDVKPKGPEQTPEAEGETQARTDMSFESQFPQPTESQTDSANEAPEPLKNFHLQDLLANADLETLEKSVERGVKYLAELKAPIKDKVGVTADASQWIAQIEKLESSAVKTKTIIGVVGNTGAGKSSVINAMLDEECLVPTDTMRACTAVVTELSYNYANCQYKAKVEFISADDWRTEMKVLFDDLLDGNGEVSRDCANEDSDAGVAYAKIKAVYPKLTKEDIANSNPDKLLHEFENFLGKIRNIQEDDSLIFYHKLQ